MDPQPSQEEEQLQGQHLITQTLDLPLPLQPQTPQTTLHKAHNSTYILHSPYTNTLTHISLQGTILKQLQPGFMVGRPVMPSSNEIVVLVRRGQDGGRGYGIWMCQLDGYSIGGVQVQGQDVGDIGVGGSFMINSMYFRDTQLFCIYQYTKSKQTTKIKIIYFKTPLTTTSKPTHISHPKLPPQEPPTSCTQLNNHSGLVWIKQDRQFATLCVHDLRNQSQREREELSEYRFEYSFVKGKDKELYRGAVEDVWEPVEGVFYIRARMGLDIARVSKKISQQELQKLLSKETTYHILWDYKKNTTKFLDIKDGAKTSVQFTNGFRPVRNYYSTLGRQISFRMVKPMPAIYREMDLCFVDPRTWEIVGHCQEDPSCIYGQKIGLQGHTYPCYHPTLDLKYTIKQATNGGSSISIRLLQFRPFCYTSQIVSTFFMTQLIHDCQEDLLSLVSGMMEQDHTLVKQGWKKLKKLQQG